MDITNIKDEVTRLYLKAYNTIQKIQELQKYFVQWVM